MDVRFTPESGHGANCVAVQYANANLAVQTTLSPLFPTPSNLRRPFLYAGGADVRWRTCTDWAGATGQGP